MRSRKPCVAMQHRAFLLSMTRSELLCCGATCIFFGAKCCAVKPDTLDCAIRKTGGGARRKRSVRPTMRPSPDRSCAARGRFEQGSVRSLQRRLRGSDGFGGARSLAGNPRHLRAIDRTAAEGRVRRQRALGRPLHEAATDSVYRVRGRLTVPPLLPPPDAPSRTTDRIPTNRARTYP